MYSVYIFSRGIWSQVQWLPNEVGFCFDLRLARSVANSADSLIDCIVPRSVACSTICRLHQGCLPSTEPTASQLRLIRLSLGAFTDVRQLTSGTTHVSRLVQDVAQQQRCCTLVHLPCILGRLTDNNANRTSEQTDCVSVHSNKTIIIKIEMQYKLVAFKGYQTWSHSSSTQFIIFLWNDSTTCCLAENDWHACLLLQIFDPPKVCSKWPDWK